MQKLQNRRNQRIKGTMGKKHNNQICGNPKLLLQKKPEIRKKIRHKMQTLHNKHLNGVYLI